ncbi:hypothetical protein ACIGKR_12245 [Rhodococcus qingshengii]|uniref:hypothetical protein n=1 Tax=Rhodococcus qingshengii TaxID=334542 RepID=UPI0037CAABD0
MTAPDPGLTDLIAAHDRLSQHIFEEGPRYRCTCGWTQDVEWGDHSPFPAHVALVVKQHIARRIAELEASTRESVRVLVMERHRAETAEAAIARVRDVLTIGPLHRLDFPKYKDPYAIDRHVIAAAIDGVRPDRAALEGES